MLIADVKKAWRLWSMRIAGVAAAVAFAEPYLPQLKEVLPDRWYAAAFLLVMVARVISQSRGQSRSDGSAKQGGSVSLWLLSAVIAFSLGAVLFSYYGKSLPVPEVPAKAYRQPDGSLVVERMGKVNGPPVHKIPTGSKEVRRESLKVVSKAKSDCPPVSLDLSLISQVDGQRVVASSPDGEIISAVDMPVTGYGPESGDRMWSAGVSYRPGEPGVFIDRSFGAVIVGLDVIKRDTSGLDARVRLGFSF